MSGSVFALLLSFGFLMFVLVIGWYVLQVIAYWRIFTKAGQPGWKSIIPFYNTFIQYRITWDTRFFWVWLICVLGTAFCPAGGTIVTIMQTIFSLGAFILSAISVYMLSVAYGHGVPFALGLFFLQPIFMLILGFGSSVYIGPQSNGGYNRYI